MTKILCLLVFGISLNGYTKKEFLEFNLQTNHITENYSNSTSSNLIPLLDSAPPTPPGNFTYFLGDTGFNTGIDLSWSFSTDNVGVEGYEMYKDGVLLQTLLATETYYPAGIFEPETIFEFYIIAYEAAGNRSLPSTILVTTLPNDPKTYCISTSYNMSYEYIDYVGINGISNHTASDNGYGDYTHMLTLLQSGFNTIKLSVGFADTIYEKTFVVWIDFNQNEIYESTEQVVSSAIKSADITSHNFIIPGSFPFGTRLRMRVALKWDGVPDACGGINYFGEVEDYILVVMNLSLKSAISRKSTVKKELPIIIYPNSAGQYIKINLSGKSPSQLYYK